MIDHAEYRALSCTKGEHVYRPRRTLRQSTARAFEEINDHFFNATHTLGTVAIACRTYHSAALSKVCIVLLIGAVASPLLLRNCLADELAEQDTTSECASDGDSQPANEERSEPQGLGSYSGSVTRPPSVIGRTVVRTLVSDHRPNWKPPKVRPPRSRGPLRFLGGGISLLILFFARDLSLGRDTKSKNEPAASAPEKQAWPDASQPNHKSRNTGYAEPSGGLRKMDKHFTDLPVDDEDFDEW